MKILTVGSEKWSRACGIIQELWETPEIVEMYSKVVKIYLGNTLDVNGE